MMPTADKLKAFFGVLGTTPSELLSSEYSQLPAKNESTVSMSPKSYVQEQIKINKGMLLLCIKEGLGNREEIL